jgi:RimJ/RimL family protein N-acetyltransferase
MLTGKLVRLRPLEMSDLDRYLVWVNDPEVMQWLSRTGTYPWSRLAEEELLEKVSRTRGYDAVNLAIETLEGRHIGSIALHNAQPEDRKAGVGLFIGDKEYWNRGYGTDAMRTILRFGFEEMNLQRIHLTVDAENARAIACYKKCGFIEEGRLRQDRYKGGQYFDTLVMGVLVDEFRALAKEQDDADR